MKVIIGVEVRAAMDTVTNVTGTAATAQAEAVLQAMMDVKAAEVAQPGTTEKIVATDGATDIGAVKRVTAGEPRDPQTLGKRPGTGMMASRRLIVSPTLKSITANGSFRISGQTQS